jgi:hypothetical protein
VRFIILIVYYLGLGAQYSYLKQRNSYSSFVWGRELISFHPIPQIQFSAELEQLRVNINEVGSNTNSTLTGIQHYS